MPASVRLSALECHRPAGSHRTNRSYWPNRGYRGYGLYGTRRAHGSHRAHRACGSNGRICDRRYRGYWSYRANGADRTYWAFRHRRNRPHGARRHYSRRERHYRRAGHSCHRYQQRNQSERYV